MKKPKIHLGFRSSHPINPPSLCIVFSVCIIEFVSASACLVAGVSVCSIRVLSLNHHSHAAARLHHCPTIFFYHYAIYFRHRLHIRFCSFLPIFICAFFRVCELSFGRQARGRSRAKKNGKKDSQKKIWKKKSEKSQIRIQVGLTRFLLVQSELDSFVSFWQFSTANFNWL
jgi:hypothetical protein